MRPTRFNRNLDRAIEETPARFARFYDDAVERLLAAKIAKRRDVERAAFDDLVDTTRETMGLVELVSARDVLEAADVFDAAAMRYGDPSSYWNGPFDRWRGDGDLADVQRFADQPIVPRVEFDQALEDFASRVPVTFEDAAERTARKIAEAYSRGRVAGFVRSAEQTVTEKAQAVILDAIRSGSSELEVGRTLSSAVEAIREFSPGWTEAYSRMAFRTNANTAATAGRFRQVADPAVSAVIPGLRYSASRDSDTRPSHAQLRGMVLSSRNPAWKQLAPPLGYNCRCRVDLVSRFELEDLGLVRPNGTIIESPIPVGAGPDEGFRIGGRVDLLL